MRLGKNETGFNLIGILLLVVVVGVLGAAGWLVYDRQNSKDSSKPSQASQTEEDKTSTEGNNPLAATAEWTTYSKVPKELQDQILQTYKDKASGCLENGKIVNYERKPTDISIVYSSQAAEALIGCDGGFRGIYAKNKEGNWQFLLGTQSGIPCEVITQYSIPEALLKIDAGPGTTQDAECVDKDGNTKKYSQLYL